MISLDITVLYQVILFVILWVILDKVLFQPYLRLLDQRERRTTGAEHDSAELEHEGARLRAQYEEKIAQAQSAAYTAKDAIVQDARQQREKILGEARQDAARQLDQNRRQVALALEREKPLASVEANKLGGEMASKVLGRAVV